MTFIAQLERLHACDEAIAWAASQPSAQAGWDACERGDWMLWLAGKLSGEPGSEGRRKLVLAACECARLALPYVKDGDDRPMRAIEAAEDWARGGATKLGDVRAASAYAVYAVYAVAVYTASYAAASSVYAAASSVYADDGDGDAAYTADDAACAAAACAAAAATRVVPLRADDGDAAARVVTLRACADIARKHYHECPIKD